MMISAIKRPHWHLWITRMLTVLVVAFMVCLPQASEATSARELNARVADAMDNFYQQVPDARQLVSKSKGVLVFPKSYKAGLGVGGQYAQGALLVNGNIVDYYSMKGASYGFQIGAERQTVILLFMDDKALEHFRNSSGWAIDADAGVTLVDVGANDAIRTNTYNKPILAFVLNQKGLMANLSLEGTKFTKIYKH